MAHFVTIVSDQLQNVVRICRSLGWKVHIPGVLSLTVHDVCSNQPFDVTFLSFVLLISDLKETCFSLLVIPCRGTCQSIVPVEIIITLEVALDRVEIDQNIIKLFKQKETGSHALSAWNRVTFSSTCTYNLEKLLRWFQVFSGILLLTILEQSNSFDDILPWICWIEVLNQVERLFSVLILQAINDHIQSSLREQLNQGRKNLHSILPTSENNEVVSQKVTFLEKIPTLELLLDRSEDLLCILPWVHLVIVTGLEICCEYTFWIKGFIPWQDL